MSSGTPDSGIQDPEKCVLAALPDNYELRRRMRSTGVGGDTYMRGTEHSLSLCVYYQNHLRLKQAPLMCANLGRRTSSRSTRVG